MNLFVSEKQFSWWKTSLASSGNEDPLFLVRRMALEFNLSLSEANKLFTRGLDIFVVKDNKEDFFFPSHKKDNRSFTTLPLKEFQSLKDELDCVQHNPVFLFGNPEPDPAMKVLSYKTIFGENVLYLDEKAKDLIPKYCIGVHPSTPVLVRKLVFPKPSLGKEICELESFLSGRKESTTSLLISLLVEISSWDTKEQLLAHTAIASFLYKKVLASLQGDYS
jgi:hypothetical protein